MPSIYTFYCRLPILPPPFYCGSLSKHNLKYAEVVVSHRIKPSTKENYTTTSMNMHHHIIFKTRTLSLSCSMVSEACNRNSTKYFHNRLRPPISPSFLVFSSVFLFFGVFGVKTRTKTHHILSHDISTKSRLLGKSAQKGSRY